MNYETLMTKLASADLPVNAQLQNVMAKVKVAGLHNVAGKLNNIPDFNVKTATEHLGVQLLKSHYKYQKIATGLALLPGATDLSEIQIKQANFLKNFFAKARQAGTQGFNEGAQASQRLAPRGIAGLEAMGKVDPNFAPSTTQIENTLVAQRRAKQVAQQAAQNLEVPPSLRYSMPQNASNQNAMRYRQGTTTPEELAAKSRQKLLMGKAAT